GATARDWSTGARHGGLVGGASWLVGKIGSAVDFDGRSNRVMTSLRIDQKKGTAGATFAAWVKPAAADRSERCVVSTDNGGSDWSLLQSRGGWEVRTGTASRATGFPVVTGVWQHVAAVFDPAAGNVRFYRNGAEAVIRELGHDESTGNVTIGAAAPEGGKCFDGLIDEVRVCDRALSLGDVWAVYSVGARPAPPAIVSVPPTVAFSGTPYACAVAAAGNPRPKIEVKGLPPHDPRGARRPSDGRDEGDHRHRNQRFGRGQADSPHTHREERPFARRLVEARRDAGHYRA
ncbi:MAG: LamG domain-containing protein, partial [Planctomycetota bacterium]